MKIKQTLTRFLEFLRGNRQSGHTSLLNEIAKKHDVYIVIHNMDMKKEFDSNVHDKLIPINNISILQAAPNKPILLDNKVLMDLFYDATQEINRKDQMYRNSQNLIDSIKDIISNNEKTFGK